MVTYLVPFPDRPNGQFAQPLILQMTSDQKESRLLFPFGKAVQYARSAVLGSIVEGEKELFRGPLDRFPSTAVRVRIFAQAVPERMKCGDNYPGTNRANKRPPGKLVRHEGVCFHRLFAIGLEVFVFHCIPVLIAPGTFDRPGSKFLPAVVKQLDLLVYFTIYSVRVGKMMPICMKRVLKEQLFVDKKAGPLVKSIGYSH
jgi:hypothetical protein